MKKIEVFDLLNAGPRHRFTIRGPDGKPFIVSNCTQAAARDVVAEHLVDLDGTAGADVLFSVHDEAVLEVDKSVEASDIEKIMSRTPEWLEGCPIGAEAKEAPHYLK